jgi:hypothetical protein
VEVPVASAILTAINPERFTIIDFRALESLAITDRQAYYTIDFFIDYLQFCRGLANQCRVGLRTLDRALWQWSKEKIKENVSDVPGPQFGARFHVSWGIVSRKLLIGGHLQALEMVKVQVIAGP